MIKEKALELVAEFMTLSAKTAPKACAENYLEVKTISGDDIQNLGKEMIEYGLKQNKDYFFRDGENILKSQLIFLLSLHTPKPPKRQLNCGACGYEKCVELNKIEKADFEFKGPICVWRTLDLGIALGSSVKTASMFNVDNRIMYTIGVIARKLKYINGDLVVGIPMSATEKNIFFDRATNL